MCVQLLKNLKVIKLITSNIIAIVEVRQLDRYSDIQLDIVSLIQRLYGRHQRKLLKPILRRCFYHLRQLRTVRKSLTTESVKTLVQTLIASRLDYCNSIFYQISAVNLQALQSVLNSAARLIMRKRKYDRITATLRDDVHWLPIRQRIMYKLCTIVYKCVHGAAPSYIAEIPVAANIGRRLVVSSILRHILPWAKTSTHGQRSFAVSGPSASKDLPPTLCASSSSTAVGQFQNKLKTVLFLS